MKERTGSVLILTLQQERSTLLGEEKGFKHVTWNSSEKSHGKGAPDGIGGAVKREADRYVQRGGELQTPLDFYEMLAKKSGSIITYHWISEESIQKYDELIPVKVDLRDTMCHIEDPSSNPEPPSEQAILQDLSGKFVIVTYDELPYVGQVLEVVGEEVQ
ncbi:unnamed protein product, partial [Pleuronectes platessa]